MAISVQEKYLRLKEKLKDPVFYAAYQRKKLERQRHYARDPEFCKRRNLSTADWRFRKARGLPVRPRGKLRPANLNIPKLPIEPSVTPPNFDFQIVNEIKVDFS